VQNKGDKDIETMTQNFQTSPEKAKSDVSLLWRWLSVPLQTRLTVLILLITVTMLVSVASYLSYRADQLIEAMQNNSLQYNNNALVSEVSIWLKLNIQAVTELSKLPDITSMNGARQEPVLKAMAASYPNLFLVQTTNLMGINIARNDDAAPKDYHDRGWFQGAISGKPVAIEVLISRTTGKPALNLAAPIHNASGQIVGVASTVSELSDISQEVLGITIGQGGYAFVVDSTNRVVAHPDPTYTETELKDLSNYPPVTMLRQGSKGLIVFTDDNGVRWRAYVTTLDNGWGIVTQQPENELLAPVRSFQQVMIALIAAGGFIMLIAAWFTVRRTLRPVRALTEAATAIAAGDLSRTVETQGTDEIGTLAIAFNQMTTRLSDSIATLEKRVAERTAELDKQRVALETANERAAHRAAQFQAIAEVSRAITSVRDLNSLLPQITTFVSEQFGFYHTGIFLNDEANEYAVFSAANSEGGKRMIQRKHRLEIGKVGIVGYVTGTGKPRIALDTGADAVFFNNPDLPSTRSEMALPLRIGEKVIGALDVQSTEPNAFTEEDVDNLTILADLISIAIENTRLFESTRKSLLEAETVYRQSLQKEWFRLVDEQKLTGVRYTISGVSSIDEPLTAPELLKVIDTGEPYQKDAENERDSSQLAIPIILRGETLGVLNVSAPANFTWIQDQVDMVKAVTERLAIAIENARLIDETSRRANRERTVSEITTKIRGSTDPQSMLETALEELKQVLGTSNIQIKPYQPDRQDSSPVTHPDKPQPGDSPNQ
jgi:GAF domain-containing protein/HAMP domain-containing protein